MFDWDYNMYVKTLAPYIHPREYKIWRNTGLAFEWRLTENKIPNRTFSSYIPGYHVSNFCHRKLSFLEKRKEQDPCSWILGGYSSITLRAIRSRNMERA